MQLHIHRLFVMEDDFKLDIFKHDEILQKQVKPKLKVIMQPDGHALVLDADAFSALWHAFDVNDARFFSLYPDAMIDVEESDALVDIWGFRYPEAFAVDIDVVWLDYDTDRNILYAFKVKRPAYETVHEFQARMYNERPTHVIPMDVATMQLIYSFNGTIRHHFTIQDDVLRA